MTSFFIIFPSLSLSYIIARLYDKFSVIYDKKKEKKSLRVTKLFYRDPYCVFHTPLRLSFWKLATLNNCRSCVRTQTTIRWKLFSPRFIINFLHSRGLLRKIKERRADKQKAIIHGGREGKRAFNNRERTSRPPLGKLKQGRKETLFNVRA